MSDYTKNYTDLLIAQYFNKPNARAEMDLSSSGYEEIYDLFSSFIDEWDIDKATGDRLDKIGKLVGQDRIIDKGFAKIYFGFEDTPNAKGFNQAPFYATNQSKFTSTELNDTDYRFFIKSRIVKNTAYAVMQRSGTDNNLQKAIGFLFDGQAYVVDNQNMSLSLVILDTFPRYKVTQIFNERLLPSPMGVGYRAISIIPDNYFGFADDVNAKGFGVGKLSELIYQE